MQIEIKKLAHDKPSNKTEMYKNIPLFTHVQLLTNSLGIVNSLLKGTDSPEWLILAENNAYKKIKGDGDHN